MCLKKLQSKTLRKKCIFFFCPLKLTVGTTLITGVKCLLCVLQYALEAGMISTYFQTTATEKVEVFSGLLK